MQGKQVLGPEVWTLLHMSKDKRAEPASLSCMQSPCSFSTRRVGRDEARLRRRGATQLLCRSLSPCSSIQVPKLHRSYQAMTASLVNRASRIWESQLHATTLAIIAGKLVD